MQFYYVYVYLNPLKPCETYGFDFSPFYIGKGHDNRMLSHLQISSKDKNFHKINTIKKIFSANKEPLIKIIGTHLTEKEAFILEKKLISLIGRADKSNGPLTNMTNGGEGKSGAILSKETKQKISNKRQLYLSTLSDTSILATMLGKKHSSESLLKMSKNIKEALAKPETKIRRSKANTGGNNPRAKPCIVFNESFSCLRHAELKFNINKKKLMKDKSFFFIS